jgi:hypothetical protein
MNDVYIHLLCITLRLLLTRNEQYILRRWENNNVRKVLATKELPELLHSALHQVMLAKVLS